MSHRAIRQSLLVLGLLAANIVLVEIRAHAQSYGIELQNTLMPASGGMAGTSIAMPQDFLSAINANPGALADFTGTHFTFGGAWAGPTYNINQLDPLPLIGVDPYRAKSGTPGSVAGNIGVAQELSLNGLPAVFGLALISNAGAGVDFRDVPESNGTSAEYVALDIDAALAMPITDALSLGSTITLGNSYIDGPFTDTGGMVPAYGLRGTLGAQYKLYDLTNLGIYWQTKKHFHFDDAVVYNSVAYNLRFDHPENVGVGFADKSLADGRLLLAMDVVYKQYSDADFLKAIYKNQWVYQFGSQYDLNDRVKLRCGYSYNTNPMRDAAVTSIGGIPVPDGIPGLRYIQGQFAAVSQHFLTGGVGVSDVLPGIDFDVFAGGMFENSDQFASTIASVESYWIGSYLTWNFGGAKPVGR